MMVASDYRYGLFLWMGALIAVFSLLAIGAWALDGFQLHDASAILPLLFLTEGMIFLLMARRFKTLNLRRQSAAGDDLSVPLAAEQPIPNEGALSLPATITLAARRGRSFAIGGCLGLPLLLSVFWLPFPTSLVGQNQLERTLSIALFIFIFGLALGFAILLSVVLMRQYYEITATEEGLTIRQRGITHDISWREARLFAITPSIKHAGSPIFYELSSATTFAPLIRLRRHSLLPLSLKPTLPFDEYDRQMDALLSLIAARTGLPLYDLR